MKRTTLIVLAMMTMNAVQADDMYADVDVVGGSQAFTLGISHNLGVGVTFADSGDTVGPHARLTFMDQTWFNAYIGAAIMQERGEDTTSDKITPQAMVGVQVFPSYNVGGYVQADFDTSMPSIHLGIALRF